MRAVRLEEVPVSEPDATVLESGARSYTRESLVPIVGKTHFQGGIKLPGARRALLRARSA